MSYSPKWDEAFQLISDSIDALGEPTGFDNLSADQADQAISHPTITNSILSLAPPSGLEFTFFVRGIKFVKNIGSDPQTVDLSSYEAVSPNKVFVYYSATGVLTPSTDAWSISAAAGAPVCICYWNGTEWRVGDESHGCKMDADTHYRLHQLGAVYNDGFNIENTSTWVLSGGEFLDEDKTVPYSTPVTPEFDVWYRSSSNPARMTFISTGDRYTANGTQDNSKPWQTNASGIPLFDDGTGTLDTIPTNSYFCSWIFATHCDIVLGCLSPQFTHANLDSAHTELYHHLDLEERWIQESVVLYKVIFMFDGVNINYVEHRDVRGLDLTNEGEPVFDDVIINGMSGNIIGTSGSVETAIEALDLALTEATYKVQAASDVAVTNIFKTAQPSTYANTQTLIYTVTNTSATSLYANTQLDDGTLYTVREINTPSPWLNYTFRIQASLVNLATRLTAKFRYSGATTGHNIQLSIFRGGVTNAWVNLGAAVVDSAILTTYTYDLTQITPNVAEFVDLDGYIYVKFTHSASTTGNAAHYLYIDYLIAQKAIAAAAAVPSASETVEGKVELATTAEVLTGTDTTRAVTSAGVKAVADLKANLSGNTFSGTQNLNNNDLTNIKAASFNGEISTGATSGTIAVNFANGSFYTQATPTNTIGYDLTAPVGPARCQIKIVSDDSTKTVGFNTTVKWYGTAFASVSRTTGKNMIMSLYWDGAVWHGQASVEA
jgi:hypothetical protein